MQKTLLLFMILLMGCSNIEEVRKIPPDLYVVKLANDMNRTVLLEGGGVQLPYIITLQVADRKNYIKDVSVTRKSPLVFDVKEKVWKRLYFKEWADSYKGGEIANSGTSLSVARDNLIGITPNIIFLKRGEYKILYEFQIKSRSGIKKIIKKSYFATVESRKDIDEN